MDRLIMILDAMNQLTENELAQIQLRLDILHLERLRQSGILTAHHSDRMFVDKAPDSPKLG